MSSHFKKEYVAKAYQGIVLRQYASLLKSSEFFQ